jgi:hypothetical protein
MPRDSNGTYSLPTPGNPVVTLTTISSSWANTTMGDIATALTGSLARDGAGGMTGALKLDSGSSGSPALTWSAETTSGLYRAGAGDFRYQISAADVLTLTAGALGIRGTTPIYRITETGVSADEGVWDVSADAEVLRIRALTDDLGTANNAITIGRTLSAIGNISFLGTAHIFGAVVRSDTDATDDLGSSTIRWRRTYTQDARVDDTHVLIDASTDTLRLGGTGQAWTSAVVEPDFQVSRSASGGVPDIRVNNSSNTASSDARITARVAGSSAGDPYINWEIASAQQFSAGLDNSDSDIWKLQAGAVLSGTAGLSLTSSNLLRYAGLEVGFRGFNTTGQNAGYTFVADDNGKAVAANTAGSFTVNNSVFSAGQGFTFINTTGSNCTLTQGAGVTFRLMGASGTTGNRTVSDFGVATVIAQTAAVFLVGGPGVS